MFAAASTSAASAGGTSGLDVIYGIVAVVLYWLPSLTAWRRRARNVGSIVVVNFFGFLVVPWIIALAMAMADPRREPPASPPSA